MQTKWNANVLARMQTKWNAGVLARMPMEIAPIRSQFLAAHAFLFTIYFRQLIFLSIPLDPLHDPC